MRRKLEDGDFTTFTTLTEPRGLYVEAVTRGFGDSGPFVGSLSTVAAC
jgi:hypothetical protein